MLANEIRGQILQRLTQNLANQGNIGELNKFFKKNQDIDEKMFLQPLNQNNEIEELIYIGKTLMDKHKQNTKPTDYFSFLVRRKRSLEVMLTNGLTYFSDPIEESFTKSPFFI